MKGPFVGREINKNRMGFSRYFKNQSRLRKFKKILRHHSRRYHRRRRQNREVRTMCVILKKIETQNNAPNRFESAMLLKTHQKIDHSVLRVDGFLFSLYRINHDFIKLTKINMLHF